MGVIATVMVSTLHPLAGRASRFWPTLAAAADLATAATGSAATVAGSTAAAARSPFDLVDGVLALWPARPRAPRR
jgi:hypothetical protein